MFSRRRGDSRATTCRPLIATALLTPSPVLEDNLLNSSADPRKAPNEIISLDHLIRAHTTAGSILFVIVNATYHTHKHPQNTNIYTHTHVQTTQHDRFFVRYALLLLVVYVRNYIVGRPNRTFSHFSTVRFGPSAAAGTPLVIIVSPL